LIDQLNYPIKNI